MLAEGIAIYRSARRAECAERAFVLTAVGVANEITRDGTEYVLWVDAAALEQARAHLAHYQAERRAPPPPPPPPVLHARAWVG
jgi:hypothetical protein